jgi:hypothetical protein
LCANVGVQECQRRTLNPAGMIQGNFIKELKNDTVEK